MPKPTVAPGVAALALAGATSGGHGALASLPKMDDTNREGAIDRDEFSTAALARFDRAATNGGGG